MAAWLRVLWRVLKKTAVNFFHDDGFFLAMGLAFNLLLYFIPLVLMMISLLGYTFLESSRAVSEVQSLLRQFLPRSEHAFADNFAAIVAHRGLLGVAGSIFFLLFSSTLFGSARYVLNIVFQTQQRRGFFKGLLQDFLMMTITAMLLMLAIGAATLIAVARALGSETLPILGPFLTPVWWLVGKLLALALLAGLFFLFYRYAPTRSLALKSLVIASLSGAFLFEFLRWGFAQYVAFAHEVLTLYGVLSGLMFFFFWLYYASLVFVLGAEIAHAVEQSSTAQT